MSGRGRNCFTNGKYETYVLDNDDDDGDDDDDDDDDVVDPQGQHR